MPRLSSNYSFGGLAGIAILGFGAIVAIGSSNAGTDLYDEAFYEEGIETHDEYYLVGTVRKSVNRLGDEFSDRGHIFIGVREIIYSPLEVKSLVVRREELPRIPREGDVLVLRLTLGTDKHGLPEKRFSYEVVNGKGKKF